MLDWINKTAQKKLWADFEKCFSTEFAEEFLQTLLTLMQIVFVLNHEYRRNIKNFNGRYQFCSEDGLQVSAIFHNGRMKVEDDILIDKPHITITFRDGKTLMNFLISPKQDILGSMLRHDVRTEGNLNYLYKFGFMAKELQLMIPQP